MKMKKIHKWLMDYIIQAGFGLNGNLIVVYKKKRRKNKKN